MSVDAEGFLPITDPASLKDRPCLVKAGSEYACAFWTGGMWAYWGGTAPEQIDFEPTHYKPTIGRNMPERRALVQKHLTRKTA